LDNLISNEQPVNAQTKMNLRKRNLKHRFYSALADEESDSDFSIKKNKTNKKKRSEKQAVKKFKDEDENGERLVPNGVSVFDLIMPWKLEVKENSGPTLE
jgi:hypothetical protein